MSVTGFSRDKANLPSSLLELNRRLFTLKKKNNWCCFSCPRLLSSLCAF